MTSSSTPLDARGLAELDTWARRWCALERMRTHLLIEQAGLLARIRHALPAGAHRTRSGIQITVAPPRRRSAGDRSGRVRHEVWLHDPDQPTVAPPVPARRRSVTRPAPVATFTAPRSIGGGQ